MFDYWKKFVAKHVADERGAVAIIALIALGLGVALIPPTLNHIDTGTKVVTVQEDATRRLYAADAGVEVALRQIISQGSTSVEDFTLNGNTVAVSVAAIDSDTYSITATATDGEGGETSIVSYADVSTSEIPIFEHALVGLGDGGTDDDVKLMNSAEVVALSGENDADIHVNGSMYIHGGATAEGYLTATEVGGVNAPGHTYGMQDNLPPLPTPDFGQAARKTQMIAASYDTVETTSSIDLGKNGVREYGDASNPESVKFTSSNFTLKKGHLVFYDDVYFDGNITLNQSTSMTVIGGDVYINGSLTCKNKASFDIRGNEDNKGIFLIVEGDVEMKNSSGFIADIVANDELALIISLTGTFTWKNNADGNLKGIIFAPNGIIEMKNSSKINGMAIAQKIILKNSAIIEYPEDLADEVAFSAAGGEAKTSIEYWKVN